MPPYSLGTLQDRIRERLQRAQEQAQIRAQSQQQRSWWRTGVAPRLHERSGLTPAALNPAGLAYQQASLRDSSMRPSNIIAKLERGAQMALEQNPVQGPEQQPLWSQGLTGRIAGAYAQENPPLGPPSPPVLGPHRGLQGLDPRSLAGVGALSDVAQQQNMGVPLMLREMGTEDEGYGLEGYQLRNAVQDALRQRMQQQDPITLGQRLPGMALQAATTPLIPRPALRAIEEHVPYAGGPISRELGALSSPLGLGAIAATVATGGGAAPGLAAIGAGSIGAVGLGTAGEALDAPTPLQYGLEIAGGLTPAGLVRRGATGLGSFPGRTLRRPGLDIPPVGSRAVTSEANPRLAPSGAVDLGAQGARTRPDAPIRSIDDARIRTGREELEPQVGREAVEPPPIQAEPLTPLSALDDVDAELAAAGLRPMGGGNPVQRLTELIKAAKPALRETRELRRKELARRAAVLRSGLEAAGTGGEAQRKAMGALRGEMPTAAFDPPRGSLDADLIDDLKVMVRDYYRPRPRESLNSVPTFVALEKILDGGLPNRSELALLEKVYGSELARSLLDKRPIYSKVLDEAAAALSIWRMVITGGEQSVLFRQAAIPALNPRNIPMDARAVARGIRAGFSETTARGIQEGFEAAPEYARLSEAADRAGYKLFATFSEIADPMAREETFTGLERAMIGRLARRTPVIGHYLRFSERNAVTLLNSMRLDLGAKYLKMLDNLAPNGVASAVDEEAAARAVSVLTGRGKIPPGEVAQIASRALFSAQLQASRIQTPFLLFEKSGPVRMAVAKEIGAFLGFGFTILSAAKLSGAADVELDPRSSDFGKIKIGPTRVDPWGGFQQYARMVAQLATGTRKTALGEVAKLNRLEAFETFWENKLAPGPALAADIMRGETGIGETLEPTLGTVKREAFNRLLPLIVTDVVDTVREQGNLLGLAAAPLAWFGIGVQSYTAKSVKTAQMIAEDLEAGRLPDAEQYDEIPLKLGGEGGLTDRDREAFLKLHPEIAERLDESETGVSAQEEQRLRGETIGRAQDTGKERFDTLLKDISQERFGDPSEQDVRRTITGLLQDILNDRRAVIEDAIEAYGELEEGEAQSDVERAVRKYSGVFERHPNPVTDEEYSALDADFEKSLTDEELALAERELGIGDHALETAYRAVGKLLRPYYDIPIPEPEEAPPPQLGGARRRSSRGSMTTLKKVDLRQQYRQRHPETDGALWALGRVSCVRSGSALSSASKQFKNLYGAVVRLTQDDVCED